MTMRNPDVWARKRVRLLFLGKRMIERPTTVVACALEPRIGYQQGDATFAQKTDRIPHCFQRIQAAHWPPILQTDPGFKGRGCRVPLLAQCNQCVTACP